MIVEPFVHTFCTSLGYYFYDVNTDKIVKINKDITKYLNGQISKNDLPIRDREYINKLYKKGFLKNNHVKKSKHPKTDVLPFYLEKKLSYLILQVTQTCNLKCDYCVYSGGYNTRQHSSKKMNINMAKKGIDYLISHSQEATQLHLGFYGGEPLLEFNLIFESVKYMEKQAKGINVAYSITTNGILLTDEKIRFLEKYNFDILISLDGPEKIHNKSRKFAKGGQGSFGLLMKNLEYIYNKFPEYYKKKISFNTVFTTQDSFKIISDFFQNNYMLNQSSISASIVSDTYSKSTINIGEQFLEEYLYADFLKFLALLGRIDRNSIPILARQRYSEMLEYISLRKENNRVSLPEEWHHGGPCMPGVQRLFLNAEGIFYPCEKVSEELKEVQLGNIESGINVKNAQSIINTEEYTKERCRECWAYSLCNVCILQLDKEDEDIKLNENKCIKRKIEIEEMLKDYTVLMELGGNFDYHEKYLDRAM